MMRQRKSRSQQIGDFIYKYAWSVPIAATALLIGMAGAKTPNFLVDILLPVATVIGTVGAALAAARAAQIAQQTLQYQQKRDNELNLIVTNLSSDGNTAQIELLNLSRNTVFVLFGGVSHTADVMRVGGNTVNTKIDGGDSKLISLNNLSAKTGKVEGYKDDRPCYYFTFYSSGSGNTIYRLVIPQKIVEPNILTHDLTETYIHESHDILATQKSDQISADLARFFTQDF